MAMTALHIDITEDMEIQHQSQPTKLFLGGITKTTTTKHLREHFQRYGRVLDCVAMRQPDGKSRGFGYVTFESAAAASKCMNTTQVIDNRVIDVKLAVPEGSSPSSAAPMTPMSASSASFTPAHAFGMWHSSPYQTPYLYDVMPPWACANQSFDMLSEYSTLPHGSIFPSLEIDLEEATEKPVRMEPLSVSSSLVESSGHRRPLGDVTNTKEAAPQGKKTEKSCKFSIYDAENTAPNVISSPAREKPLRAAEDASVEAVTPMKDLPSVGSALHATGGCQRCNFFANGRCNNGQRCNFCHFEHEKKKVTRQEKRERRERWLSKQVAQEEETVPQWPCEDTTGSAMLLRELQRFGESPEPVVSAPPGLTPIKRTAEKFALSTSTMASTPLSAAVLPRSLLATSPFDETQITRPPPLQLLSTTPSPMRPPPPPRGSCQWPSSEWSFGPAQTESTMSAPMMVSMGTQTDSDDALCCSCGRDLVKRNMRA